MSDEVHLFRDGFFIVIFAFLIYVLICGNHWHNTNGFVGVFYQFVFVDVPDFIAKLICCRFYRKDTSKKGKYQDTCWQTGPCKYMVATFFACMYAFFVYKYFTYIYPSLIIIFPKAYKFHQILSFLVLPWPWIIFLIFQKADPGIITPRNVESYLKIYPHDHVLYKKRLCPTEHIPIVPRSRYCRYTKHRIAYFSINSIIILMMELMFWKTNT